MEFLIGVFDT